MAVTVVSEPNDKIALSEGVKWTFQLSDIGTYPERKELLYRLLIDGAVASEYKCVRLNSTSDQISVDFTDEVSWRLKSIFSCTGEGSDEFMAEVSVEYGEKTINEEDCEASGINVSGSTNTVMVYNAYICGMLEVPYIFSDRPDYYCIAKDACDTVTYLDTSATVNYYKDGAVVGVRVLPTPKSEVSVANLNSLNNGATYDSYVVNWANGKTWRVGFNCCADTTLYFLEPKGSWSPFPVNILQKAVKHDDRSVNIENPDHIYEGYMNMSDYNYDEFTVGYKVYSYEENEIWLRALMAASHYKIKWQCDKGNYIIKNFKVETSSRVYYRRGRYFEFELTGVISDLLKAHH